MKDIKVRGLSSGAVATIDEKAKKKGKSRNEYLKEHLETLSVLNSLKESESRYITILNKVMKLLEYNTLALNKFCEVNLLDLEEIVKEQRFKEE